MKVDLYTKIVLTAIAIGLFLNVAGDSKLSVVKDASADVAGMSWFDLKFDYDFKKAMAEIAKNDRDFKRAVEKIAEGCSADGFVGSGGGYVTLDVDC